MKEKNILFSQDKKQWNYQDNADRLPSETCTAESQIKTKSKSFTSAYSKMHVIKERLQFEKWIVPK